MLIELLRRQKKQWNNIAAWDNAVAICHDQHSRITSKKALWVFNTGKDRKEKGKVICYGCKSIDCCVFVLCNDILMQQSDLNVTEGQWLREIFYVLAITEKTVIWLLHGFIGTNIHQLKGNLMSCPAGSTFISLKEIVT